MIFLKSLGQAALMLGISLAVIAICLVIGHTDGTPFHIMPRLWVYVSVGTLWAALTLVYWLDNKGI